jgi:hypothetical protein
MRKTSSSRPTWRWLNSALGSPILPTLIAVGLLGGRAAQAASVTYDFNSDPSALLDFGGTLWNGTTTTGTGSAIWKSTGGAGPVGNTTNGPVKAVSGDGYLQITFATATCGATPTAYTSGLSGCVLFDDFDKGLVIAGFTFEADLRIGDGDPNPADGFSINYARASDPVLVALAAGDLFPDMNGKISLNGGQFRDNGSSGDLSLMEEGCSTGLALGFDMWDSGNYTVPPSSPAIGLAAPGVTHDGIGLDVIVDDVVLSTLSMPNGTTQGTSDQAGNALTASDPNGNNAATDPLSLETGPFTGTGCGTNLSWVHLKVIMDTNGVLNVFWKNKQLLTNYATTFFPSPGRLILASRVGGNTANIGIDNVQITTIPATEALVGPATGFIDGFSVQVGDSGQSTIDTNQPVLLTLNGQSVTPTSVSKSGGTTTVIYHAGFPTILGSGSTNTWSLTAKDTVGNPIASGLRTFVAPTYAKVPSSDAVTGVDTTKPGFRMFTWQSDGQPNRVYWSDEQLLGMHGANQADLTGFNDGGYLDWTAPLNFFTAPTAGAAGNFGTNNGYPDVQFPGLAGTAAHPYVNNPSASIDILTFLKFTSPGLYEMGVNSDDGFAVFEGLPNPKDRFATLLGQFDGGRGPSDTRFTFVITNAGTYPFRLLYENGAGGTGALEWFLVNNGIRVLINDTSPTNTTGVTAYYSGPALPAYVSHIAPYAGQGGARPDQVVAQITDGSTTVNQGSVKLTISGSGVTSPAAVINKAGAVTTATLSFSPLLSSGSNYTATLVWSDSATPPNTHSNTWAFSVLSYNVTLDSSLMVPASAVDKTQLGLNLQVTQLDPATVNDSGDGLGNRIDANNALLAGLFFPWYGTNVADLQSSSAASGAAYTNNNYIWTNAIDFNDTGSGGDFPLDFTGPGIPGLTGNQNNFARGFDCWVIFPTAGFYEMGVNSDDGFRLSESVAPSGNAGLRRQILHVTGTGIDTDVAASVSLPTFGQGGFGALPPVTPISGQVMFVNSNNYTPGTPINLAGKIALVDIGLYGAADFDLCYAAQTNGAIAVITINKPANGLPYAMGGGSGLLIPAMNVNGDFGQRDWWLTNGTLTASVGASDNVIINGADYGKGMSHQDAGFVVPAAGAYPMHLTYFQGGGGAGLEWTTVTGGLPADGIRHLVNDGTDSSAMLAYLPTSAKVTVVSRPTVTAGTQGGKVAITFTGTLTSSATVNGAYAPVAGATSPYTPPAGTPVQFYRSHN